MTNQNEQECIIQQSVFPLLGDEMTMRKVSKWVFPYTKGKYVTHWKPIAKPKEVKE